MKAIETKNEKATPKELSTTKFIVYISIIAILGRIGLFLRDYSLGTDDGIYAMSARHVANGLTPFKDVFSSQGGWFIELIALPVRIFGDAYWAPRVIPVIAGIAIGILTGLIAKRFMPTQLALYCGGLCAFSGTLIRTTSAITSDGVVIAFSLGTILMMYKFIEDSSTKNAIWFGVILGMGCSIKSIFMIPTIIFLIVATYNTPLVKRLIGLGTSLVIFIIPFLIFVPKNVWDQSVVYHLEKDDERKIGTNLAKIFSTLGKFDIALSSILVVASTIYIYQLFRKNPARSKDIKLLTLAYSLPTFLLLVLQTPLFRNHLAILIPGLMIISFYVLSTSNMRMIVTFLCSFYLIGVSIISLSIVENDHAFSRDKGYRQASENLAPIEKGKVMLTNDPGFAYDNHMDIPKLLEDTSKYRFSSNTKGIELNDKTFAKYVDDKDVCSVVVNTKTASRQFDISDKLDFGWDFDQFGRYDIWIKSSEDCMPALSREVDRGNGTGSYKP